MKTPFEAGYTITQEFGENPNYYDKFGFEGHEGVDLIPYIPGSSWNIYAIEGGVVVRDLDVGRDNYGNHVVIWNQETRRGWWYCHLKKNELQYGDRVAKGDLVGVMGETGNTSGAHLHLGLRLTDEDGYAIDKDNGYKGYIDPLPILEDLAENGEDWRKLYVDLRNALENLLDDSVSV